MSLQLSDQKSVEAVARIARRHLRSQGIDPDTANSWMFAIATASVEDAPEWLLRPSSDVAAAGALARATLEGMLEQSSDAHLKKLAEEELDRAARVEGQVVDPLLIGAAWLVTMALLSKTSYKGGKWAVSPGFPGFSEVLSKVSDILKHLPSSHSN